MLCPRTPTNTLNVKSLVTGVGSKIKWPFYIKIVERNSTNIWSYHLDGNRRTFIDIATLKLRGSVYKFLESLIRIFLTKRMSNIRDCLPRVKILAYCDCHSECFCQHTFYSSIPLLDFIYKACYI